MIDQASEHGIESLYAAWYAAFRARDVEAILELLTPDYFLWAPGAPPLGREALRSRLEAAFQAYELTPRFECEERLVDGDLAFERGWDEQMIRPRSGGEPQTIRSRVFLVLQRTAGRWRFARGMSQAGPAT